MHLRAKTREFQKAAAARLMRLDPADLLHCHFGMDEFDWDSEACQTFVAYWPRQRGLHQCELLKKRRGQHWSM